MPEVSTNVSCNASAVVEHADGTVQQPGVLLNIEGLDLSKLLTGGAWVECFDEGGALLWSTGATFNPTKEEDKKK